MSPLRYRYQTIEIGDIDLHLRTLRDRQQFHDPDGVAERLGISSAFWPLFGVVWPSSLVLANYLHGYDTADKRILEVGCGIGLASLMLNKQHADISATDHHPEVEGFLLQNTALNDGEKIHFERLDWNKNESQLGCFDLIIGSDLLYEDQHIEQLAKFIDQHAKPVSEVLIVDPGRGRKNKFSDQMAGYGFTYTHFKPQDVDYLSEPFKGHILCFNRDHGAKTG